MLTAPDQSGRLTLFRLDAAAGRLYRMTGSGWAWDDLTRTTVSAAFTGADASGRTALFAAVSGGTVLELTGSGWQTAGQGYVQAADGSRWFLATATVDLAGEHAIYYAGNGQLLRMPGAAVQLTTSNGLVEAVRPGGVMVLGFGHPDAGAGLTYSAVTGTLFDSRTAAPSYLDVRQGQVGDCWLLASLAEVAARAPSDIINMFTYDGTVTEDGAAVGLYTVRFYNSSGVAEYVTVDMELPDGGGYYDQPQNGVLWVALAEKAYAVANGAGFVTTQHANTSSYAALDEGMPAWALKAITGKAATTIYSVNATAIANAWNSGQLVVLCTSNPTSSYIVGSHCYALVNYNPSSNMPFEVYNPWGTDGSGWAPGNSGTVYGLFKADGTFLAHNFADEAFDLT